MAIPVWTEDSRTGPAWFESVPALSNVNGFSMFGLPIPIVNGKAYAGGDATWSENSGSAAAYTELSATAPTWTEGSI